jgi:hypothetical protein
MSADTVLTPLFPDVRPQEGTLEPGRTRTFEASINLMAAGVSLTESLIYPLSVDLRSGDTAVAELRTPVLFFFQTPLHPLSFAWTVELAPPITFGPDGSFTDDSIEREVAPGGRIAAQVAMLHALAAAGTPVNVALSPVLIATLQRMSGGYRIGDRLVPQGEGGSGDAQRLMASLRDSLAAPTTDVFVYPFAAPQLPAMLRSGLGRDLDLQIDRGRDLVSSALGFTPSSAAARAPGGQLDRSAIQRLAADGATTLLVDAGTVDRPAQDKDFTVLPTATLDGPGGGDPIGLVLPDPGVQDLLGSGLPGTDPVLAAQQVLGLLATTWQELPSTPRGIAVNLTADLRLPARFWEAFGRRVSTAPLLDPVTAEELVSRVPPTYTAELLAPSTGFFTTDYVAAIRDERHRIDALTSLLPGDAGVADQLTQDLLYAEAGSYVSDPTAGHMWIDAVDARTQAVFARTLPKPDQVFTLASGNTRIPLLMPGSDGPPLQVTIELESAQLRFPDGAERTVTIGANDQIVTFPVEATGAGQGSVRVRVLAPNGRELSETNFVVRSTAFNRVAVAITFAAALGLVVLWVRRLVARRRTT